jgi:hypothetical protein
MNPFRRFLAICLSVVFVISAVLALILFNFERRGFAPATYQRVFVNEGFYDRLPLVLAQMVGRGSVVDDGELPLVMRGMDPLAWEAFFRTILSEESLQVMGDDALNSIFAYLNMESDSAKMSILPLKRSMTGEAGVNAVYTLLNAQTDCTFIQVAQMTINLVTAQDIQFCKPPLELYPLLTPVIEAQMEVTAFVLPDEITFVDVKNSPSGEDPRIRLQIIRTMMLLTPILPLAALFMLTLLAVNSLKTWLNWWGHPLLATGLMASLISMTGAPVIGALLRRAITQRAPDFLPGVLSDYASDLGSAMTQAMLLPVLIEGIALALLGTLMIVIARYFFKPAPAVVDPAEARTII